jgi:hypothetical protein
VLGAATTVWEQTGLARGLPEEAEIDQAKQALQAILGAQDFAVAWAEGRAMPLDEAVECALSRL